MAAALSGRSVVVVFILLGVASVASSNFKGAVEKGQWMIKIMEEELNEVKTENELYKAINVLSDEFPKLIDAMESFNKMYGNSFLMDPTPQMRLYAGITKHTLESKIEKNASKIKNTERHIKEIKQMLESHKEFLAEL